MKKLFAVLLVSFAIVSLKGVVMAVEAEEVGGIRVEICTLCEGVKDRQPEGEAVSFSNDVGRIYLWTKIIAPEAPTKVRHVWYYNDKEMADTTLNVNYPSTRTWSYKTIMSDWVGNWYVKVVDMNGNKLKKIPFTVGTSAEINEKKRMEEAVAVEIEETVEKEAEEQDSAENMKALPVAAEAEVVEEEMKVSVKLGTGVSERELVGESKVFSDAVGRVYCWSNVTGAEAPTSIYHKWYYEGEKISDVTLSIKYPNTRTWSYKTIMPEWVGKWLVEITDIDGKVLEKVSFKIKP